MSAGELASLVFMILVVATVAITSHRVGKRITKHPDPVLPPTTMEVAPRIKPNRVSTDALFIPLGEPQASPLPPSPSRLQAKQSVARDDSFAPMADGPVRGMRCFVTGAFESSCTCPMCAEWRKNRDG